MARAKSFLKSKTDLRARSIYARKRPRLKPNRPIVFAASQSPAGSKITADWKGVHGCQLTVHVRAVSGRFER